MAIPERFYDEKCHLCASFMQCTRSTGSNGCPDYSFYKCDDCNKKQPDGTCYRGGKSTSEIRFCTQK